MVMESKGDMNMLNPVIPAAAAPQIPTSPQVVGTLVDASTTETVARLRDAAMQLETLFLAEMLKSAGLGAQPTTFGGGAGEEQFTSFLIDAQAREMAAAGGIGLAETLFRALFEKSDAS